MERATATAEEEEEEEGEDDIVCLDESFFINDDYQLTTFTFGSQVLQLFCLQSASSVTGILCSRFCCEVILTDHNEEVLKILNKNIDLHSSTDNSNGSAGLMVERLEWGNSDQLDQILNRHPGGFDLVLGADICFQQSSIPLLFDTVQQLLHIREEGNCKFLLAYVSRAKVMDAMVISEAISHGLQITEIVGSRSVVGNLEGVIFEITLQ
ncbi:protein N-lysine methyltransferase METTL21A isoform X2 [Camellia sinensis]|uniref:protein N-lysine methyltransferase METTL21A isoform X2 n=1 Tax=Camellia sinensis TaxID=4442 RepID=UPI0010356386|nr:protein N-lysine methyltransferase METTL21A isoform X2 [Camellia sinensis]